MFTGCGNKKYSFRRFVLDIVKNPMILGALVGTLCIGIRTLQSVLLGSAVFTIKEDFFFVYETVNKLKTMTTPLALMVLGAQFTFSAVRGLFKEILVGTLWRIVLAPLIGIGLAAILSKYTAIVSFDVNDYPALIALFGAPVAVPTGVVATEMGGDEQLATQLVVWSSLGSVITIYAAVCIMIAFGLLTI